MMSCDLRQTVKLHAAGANITLEIHHLAANPFGDGLPKHR
jgi:hypothetical protein